MRTSLVLATMTVAMLAFVASAATASSPTKVTFHSSFSFEDTATCPGTTIIQSNEERDTIIEFSPVRLHIQRHGVATLTANGKTLTSNFSAKIFLDLTTSLVKVVGTIYNIQVPGGGNLLLDAGSILMDVSSDPPTVIHVGGPHPQFFGDVASLCDYLAAP